MISSFVIQNEALASAAADEESGSLSRLVTGYSFHSTFKSLLLFFLVKNPDSYRDAAGVNTQTSHINLDTCGRAHPIFEQVALLNDTKTPRHIALVDVPAKKISLSW